MSPYGPGCVKTCEREERAELFSLLSPRDSGRQRFLFSKLAKSSRKFYPQIRFRIIHTAWAQSGHAGLAKRMSALSGGSRLWPE
jgi:hypothetical protein